MGTVKKVYQIQAPPALVFEALTETAHIQEWTGDEAKMGKKAGSKFSLWGGSILGVNKEVTAQRIVQDWREDGWDDFSQVTFFIRGRGDHTELELLHEAIPDASVASIDSGWDDYYLGPLKDYVEESLA